MDVMIRAWCWAPSLQSKPYVIHLNRGQQGKKKKARFAQNGSVGDAHLCIGRGNKVDRDSSVFAQADVPDHSGALPWQEFF
eukprot:scaffold51211_cov57-Attheya_sp.AAC.2